MLKLSRNLFKFSATFISLLEAGLYFPLLNYRIYWVFRRTFSLFLFQLRRIFYSWRERNRERAETTSIVWQLVNNFWTVALYSFVTLVALELAEHACHLLLPSVFNYLPNWLTQSILTLQEFIKLDQEIITQFLDTIAGVGGTFLGLYFAAISVVAGAMFVNVPGVVREQLVREKAGNVYVKELAFLTSSSILLLVYKSIGGNPGFLNLVLLAILSLFSVFSFLLLGTRVFNFFDYAELSNPIFGDVYREIRLATIKGFAWNDENFQTHYQKIASQHLRTLRVFVQTVLSKKAKEEEPLIKIVRRLINVLGNYQKEKRLIPTKSKWFESIPIHENWFLADTTSLTLALNTHIGLQPKFQPNAHWFEDEVIRILQESFSNVLGGNQISTAHRMLEPVSEVLKIYGEELALKEAEKVLSLTREEITFFAKTLDKQVSNRIKSNDYNLALVDYHGYSILTFILGVFTTASNFDLLLIENRTSRITWRNPKSIYNQGFPCSMLSQLEFVGKTTNFERKVEGSSISPEWYRNQLVSIEYMRLLAAGLEKVVRIIRTEYVNSAQSYLDQEQFVFAAMHAHRGLEACDKFHFHVAKIKEKNNSFEKIRIIKELPWPQLDWKTLGEDVSTQNDKLVGILADCLPPLAGIEREVTAPDIFGQSYNTVYEHIMHSLRENREKDFKRMFSSVFVSAMMAHSVLQKDESLTKADTESKLIFGSEPIIDLLDISGFAKIYAELYMNPELWRICADVWNKYLDEHENTPGIIKYFVWVAKYRRSIFKMIPRDVLRTNWKMQLDSILRKQNLIDGFVGDRHLYGDDIPLEHRSPFIRAFCHGRYDPFMSAVEVFIELFLLQRVEAKDIEFKGNHDFVRHLKQESIRQERKEGT